jgi:hypothetical protein
MKSGFVESSMQCFASSWGSEVFRYRAGMMASVSTSAPNFHALPLNFIEKAPNYLDRITGSTG